MIELCNMKELNRSKKISRVKERLSNAARDVGDWFHNNKEMIVFFGPAVIGIITTTLKVFGKRANLHKEERVKNLYCYDRSLGHYWALRRELSNREWIEIDRRKKHGERLSDILSEMKVLK